MLAPTLPANTLQGMMQLCCDALVDEGNTFYSQRVFDLFPQIGATTSGGTWAHAADASNIFGSELRSSGAQNDAIEWDVYVPAGTYTLSTLAQVNTDQGIITVLVDNVSAGTIDYYGALTRNSLKTLGSVTLTEGVRNIKLKMATKNASASSYYLNLQHCQLIKQDSGSTLASVANVPHIINVPIVFADSHSGWNTLIINTSQMFGTHVASAAAQNNEITFSFWAPKGDFTLALLYRRTTGAGIATVYVDGSSIGTIDTYGANAYNILNTSLTGTLASTGIHTIRFVMASKNASSSSYGGYIQHIQIRMTSITEPLSQDLAPEVALLWPVFSSQSGWTTITASSLDAYYYHLASSGAQNDNIAWVTETGQMLRPGTYRLDILAEKRTGCGKIHCLVDTVDLGNVDTYGTTTYNNVLSISGLTLTGFNAHGIMLKMASKNASASSYTGRVTLARLVRTGA